jgi:hypothetical protein
MTVTSGAFPGDRIRSERDADVPRRVLAVEPFTPDRKLTFPKLDAVFKPGNATRDDVPSHLVVAPDVPPTAAELYQHMCLAAASTSGREASSPTPSRRRSPYYSRPACARRTRRRRLLTCS